MAIFTDSQRDDFFDGVSLLRRSDFAAHEVLDSSFTGPGDDAVSFDGLRKLENGFLGHGLIPALVTVSYLVYQCFTRGLDRVAMSKLSMPIGHEIDHILPSQITDTVDKALL